jgi:geranylgeranyl diphosphate synthase type I
MDGTLGKQYLKEQIKLTHPLLETCLEEEVNKAKEFGNINAKLLQKFKEISLEGKRIRAALINLAYEACGGTDIEEIQRTGIFIEIFHTGILIQDDFMDRATTRRGISAVHEIFKEEAKNLNIKTPATLYGDSMATNLGDFSFFLAWERLIQADFPFDRVRKACSLFAEAARNLVHGQVLDLTLPGLSDVKEEEILKMLWTKSGDYTALLPLKIGAILAGEKNETKLDALEKYAYSLGWAFQIQDDILGTFGEAATTGKPVGDDIKDGKNTLLILHLRKNGSPEQKEFLNYTLGNEKITKNDVEKLQKILKDSGSYDYVIKKGWSYVEEGKKHIPQITENPKLQDVLESLLIYMMARTK